ncbi:MAG: hypothetical protein ACLP19_00720 [Xanthobacteraceae bacterium]
MASIEDASADKPPIDRPFIGKPCGKPCNKPSNQRSNQLWVMRCFYVIRRDQRRISIIAVKNK